MSISDTVPIPDDFGISHCQPIVHNWIPKADLRPQDGILSNHVAVNEAVIQLHGDRFWLYAAIVPATSEFRQVQFSDANDRADR